MKLLLQGLLLHFVLVATLQLQRQGITNTTASNGSHSSINDYAPNAGIYFSTYGGPLSAISVSQSSLQLLDAVLSYPYVAGVAHYQNWSTLEVAEGVFNWTVLDAVFAAAHLSLIHI